MNNNINYNKHVKDLQNIYLAVAFKSFSECPIIPISSGIPIEHWDAIETLIRKRFADAEIAAENFAKDQVAKYPNLYSE